jgi:hypothetical protein
MTMKLSDAIRLGAMATPKADGVFFDPRKEATCAQGAALLAIGQLDRKSCRNHARMMSAWPWIVTTRATCPSCGKPGTVRSLIPHLNNEFGAASGGHGWNRNRIAGWIATLEPKEDERSQETLIVGAQSLELTADSSSS